MTQIPINPERLKKLVRPFCSIISLCSGCDMMYVGKPNLTILRESLLGLVLVVVKRSLNGLSVGNVAMQIIMLINVIRTSVHPNDGLTASTRA